MGLLTNYSNTRETLVAAIESLAVASYPLQDLIAEAVRVNRPYLAVYRCGPWVVRLLRVFL